MIEDSASHVADDEQANTTQRYTSLERVHRHIIYMTKRLTGMPPVSLTCDAHDTRVKLFKENRRPDPESGLVCFLALT